MLPLQTVQSDVYDIISGSIADGDVTFPIDTMIVIHHIILLKQLLSRWRLSRIVLLGWTFLNLKVSYETFFDNPESIELDLLAL